MHRRFNVISFNYRNTYDASVQSLPATSDVTPKRMFGYVIQKPVEQTADYIAPIPSHCGCQECAAAFEESKMPSIMLPVQYTRMRRSTDWTDTREKIKQRYTEKLSGHVDKLKTVKVKTVESFEKTKQYAQEQVAKIKSSVSPIISKPSEFIQGFRKNFEKPVVPRARRSVTETPYTKPLMPTLKVVESHCPVIQELKDNSEFRSRIAQPDVLQYMPEVGVTVNGAEYQKRCPQCGNHLAESMCRTCVKMAEAAQPQYFRYVDGVPVPFVPGTTQSSKRSAQADFFVYDRFGHKYEENNGNLRLIAPEFAVDPQTAQPNIEAFAEIINANREVMDDVNHFHGDRMVPQPTDLASDVIDFVHDLARRDVKYPQENANVPAPEQPTKPNNSKSHYQIIPIHHENRTGSLISRIYSNNGKVEHSANDRQANGHHESNHKWTVADYKDETRKPISLQKINQNNKEYEVLTIDTQQSADSAEEFDRIMKFLHSGRMKRNA